jgi:endonuclease YncB( thermonuclease family)
METAQLTASEPTLDGKGESPWLLRSAVCLLLCLSPLRAEADDLTGRPAVVSADTISINGEEVRLLGVDAPEVGQTCWDGGGQPWDCGQRAALAITEKIHDEPVTCRGVRRDQGGRLLAVCELGSTNLNAWLVAEGWALAYRPQSLAFVSAEESAREGGKGIWAGAFEPPWVWRTKK